MQAAPGIVPPKHPMSVSFVHGKQAVPDVQ